ncbi:MAG: dihydroorotate dehydrogenase electron transfer subunit [Coriobacteriales bacterium]|jgi:dihydroorotate dehydrogenase electron transfer subunit|nr:dihydroorotate dehydrogenase electron transfer subunit [Coriobacteriales bacterium]
MNCEQKLDYESKLNDCFLEDCVVLRNYALSDTLWRLDLRSDLIAPRVLPGQFVHLCVSASPSDCVFGHLLRRPLSVYFANNDTISLIYQLVGRGTRSLICVSAGSRLSVLGPIGSCWSVPALKDNSCGRALLVGGGIGTAALHLLARQLTQTHVVDFVVGAANASMLVCNEDLLLCGEKLRLHIATDDGSAGHHGFTIDLLPELVNNNKYHYLATCGPEIMQRKVAALAKSTGIYCDVSLERRMACGIGACLSCSVDTIYGKKRACVDGPVFNAEEILW